jgi:hypothetical protein
MDIEDRLLEYERKLLQNEKLNYLWYYKHIWISNFSLPSKQIQ